MPRPTTHIQLKSWIGKNKHLLKAAKGWKQLDKIFQANGFEAAKKLDY